VSVPNRAGATLPENVAAESGHEDRTTAGYRGSRGSRRLTVVELAFARPGAQTDDADIDIFSMGAC
jgi:hypothetical protein